MYFWGSTHYRSHPIGWVGHKAPERVCPSAKTMPGLTRAGVPPLHPWSVGVAPQNKKLHFGKQRGGQPEDNKKAESRDKDNRVWRFYTDLINGGLYTASGKVSGLNRIKKDHSDLSNKPWADAFAHALAKSHTLQMLKPQESKRYAFLVKGTY